MPHNGGPDRSKTIIRYRIYFTIIFYLILKNVKASLPFDSQPEERELCTGLPDIGPCKNSIQKWYFTGSPKDAGNCTMYIWGGCGGNPSNRFNSEIECLTQCIGDTYTFHPTLTSASLTTTLSTTPKPLLEQSLSTVSPLPIYDRGKELTFAETGYHKTFMFAKDNTFIQLDGEVIQRFQLRLCREISFRFRTRLPHGLLVYHNVKNSAGLKMQPYALYVIVEKGQLKAVHVFGKHLTSVTVGQGLNKDEWHNVVVRIDVHGARLIAKVDQHQEEAYLKGLNHDTNYGISTNLTSVVLVGGLSSEEKLHGVKYIIESFVGCISDVVLSSGKAASDLLPIEPLIATKHENVNEGCINICRTRKNLCFFGSQCINHYNDYSCDCFGMKYEGELCDIYAATILTLRGSSYVSYRVYDWKDRVHSSVNRISLIFKTRFDDSALFYASGETSSLKHHYIAASLHNRSVYIEMDFGDGVISDYIGNYLNSNHWNNLTINHINKTVIVTLDEYMREYEIPGSSYHLYIDPEIYIGGGPKLSDKKGLMSHNNFAGSFKYVFYNDISILYELKKGNPKVHYIGVLEPEFYETDVEVIPITYPFASSHIWWPIDTKTSFNLIFDFKSSQNMAVLAYSDIYTNSETGFWEVRMVKGEIRFELVPDSGKNITHLTSVKYNTSGTWHTVELEYRDGYVKLTVDYKNKETKMFGLEFYLADKVIIGSGLKSANLGLIGCMKDIVVNNIFIEPRYVIRTERVVGEVAIDNCNFIDPCSRPNTCEHNGRCSVKNDRISCDCSDTGYIGQNCHFATFRKTCEELALLGYTKPDVYLIDIDGNGRFPPAHVKCEFQTSEDATKTIVEHNLPSQVDVRSYEEKNFIFKIKYREFTAEMLQELISHSLYCSQYIKYDCYMAPLDLHSATWFHSSANNITVDYIGDQKKGSCPCSLNKTCFDPSLSCNCDVNENKWHSDEGYYKQPHSLGITEMVFLQQKDLNENSKGRITLGPLECVETNTQQYVVTFTTSQSYIEVPGWRKGDIAFSFRTTGTSAILLFQPPIRPNYPSFMVALTSDYQLTFNFTLNTGTTREMVINSTRKLNGGEWHKIWIDYNFYHVRFMLNTNYQMVDLLLEEEFGPFEGSMFIGGATADLLKKSAVKQGLIGCFRGLVVNGEILDIYSYMSVHLSEIIKDCKPSCVPNPCQNKAVCKELWSTFQCICKNPWAHLGPRCEININTKALTFLTPDSYLRKNYLSANTTIEEKNRLKKMMFENLLLNLRTYDNDALILYANDHLNNFFHLYIAQGNRVVYLFNHGSEIVNLSVFYESINKGESIQIAIIREENSTTLHVNERNSTINKTALLLSEYSNKPWTNPETEVLKPQRPPAPPADYFQINLGGMDPHSLQTGNAGGEGTNGYVGCVRGLKIGTHVVDLPLKAQQSLDQDLTGILPHCNMRCDLEPCKNGGICTEDISRQESSCDCEHTSYFGEFCMEEKGADFNGESVLQRKFILDGFVENIKVQLAFSSNDLRQKNTVLLLLQTLNQRSYYLLIAITPDGHLKFEEDREGAVYGAEENRNFIKGARHFVYYSRNGTEASLFIDRKEIKLEPFTAQQFIPTQDIGSNEVQIGGVNTTDPRFAIYKGYNGCLSNIYLSVNSYDMKPLEEYMLFTKNGAEKVIVTNSQGVRSAQCSSRFDLPADMQLQNIDSNTHNSSLGTDKTWVEDPPSRIPYIPVNPDTSTEEESSNIVFIIMCTIFTIIIVVCSYEVWRSNRRHKKRLERETDENIIWSKEQATKMHESPGFGLRSHTYKQISMEEPQTTVPKKTVTIAVQNGVKSTPVKSNGVNANEISTPNTAPIVIINKPDPEINQEEDGKPKQSQPKRISFRDSVADQELAWEPLSETSELLAPDQEITDMDSADSDAENSSNSNHMPRLASEESITLPPAATQRQRKLARGPPTLTTPLPFKIDEHGSSELLASNA